VGAQQPPVQIQSGLGRGWSLDGRVG